MRVWRHGSSSDAHFALLIATFFAWLCIYGGLIFTYANGDSMLIRNPDLPLPLKLVDEGLLALIILSAVLGNRIRWDRRYVVAYMAIGSLVILAVYIALRQWSLQLGGSTFDMKSVLFAKNLIYVGAFLFLLTLCIGRGLYIWLLGVLNVFVTVSLLIGSIHYFLSQDLYDAYGRRLLATYANPNSAGFVAVLNITLTYSLYVARMKTSLWSLAAVTVSAFSLFLAGSVTAVAMLAGICGWIVQYPLWTRPQYVQHDWQRKTAGVGLAVLLGLTSAFLISPIELNQGYLAKAYSIMSRVGITGLHEFTSPSIDAVAMIDRNPWDMTEGRVQSYKSLSKYMSSANSFLFGSNETWIPQDASFVNFMHLSGAIGVTIFVSALIVPVIFVYKSRKDMLQISGMNQSGPKTHAADIMQWTIVGFIIMAILLNFMTQYSFEIPPTNAFAFLFAFALIKLHADDKRTNSNR